LKCQISIQGKGWAKDGLAFPFWFFLDLHEAAILIEKSG